MDELNAEAVQENERECTALVINRRTREVLIQEEGFDSLDSALNRAKDVRKAVIDQHPKLYK